MSHRIIVLFGDSLTQYGHGCERAFSNGAPGWGDRLNEVYARRADVINRGCTQYNTKAALQTNLVPDIITVDDRDDFDDTKEEQQVVFATVWFGANDSCDPQVDSSKHVPLDEYKNNLKQIVARARKLTSKVIFLTPTPINEKQYREWRLPQVQHEEAKVFDRRNSLIQTYAQSCKAVANELGIPCIDTYTAFEEVDSWSDRLLCHEDGLHLSGLGDKLVFDLLSEKIKQTWPELVVYPCKITNNYTNSGSNCVALQPVLPFWDKIDPRNYRRQLGDIAPASEEEEDEEQFRWPARPAIVLLGDSITQQGYGSSSWCQALTDGNDFSISSGWGDLIAARYSRRLDVYNRGLAGYNSRWCLAAFESVFAAPHRRPFPVELVTIFFGANDAADSVLNPTQHVPIAEFESNMEELVRRCRNEWDARRIVVIGCPPIDKEKYLKWRRNRTGNESKPEEQLLDRTAEVAKKYSLAAEKIAKKQKVPFVDLSEAFGSDPADCLSDGLHLSPKGNRLAGLRLIQVIDERWPEVKCVQDPLRKKFGFQGSVCHAFHPEQPWFNDIQFHEVDSKKEVEAKLPRGHKRVRL